MSKGTNPLFSREQIDLLAATILSKPNYQIATLAKKITENEPLFNQNIVKVVTSHQGEAIYFSRHPIPFIRGVAPETWLQSHTFSNISVYTHLGGNTLNTIAELAPSPLEKAESLEQLRWLENGLTIAGRHHRTGNNWRGCAGGPAAIRYWLTTSCRPIWLVSTLGTRPSSCSSIGVNFASDYDLFRSVRVTGMYNLLRGFVCPFYQYHEFSIHINKILC